MRYLSRPTEEAVLEQYGPEPVREAHLPPAAEPTPLLFIASAISARLSAPDFLTALRVGSTSPGIATDLPP